MKQLFLLFVVLLMVCSCSDEILNEDNHQAILGASNVTFSFDSITSPANWRTYQSLEEMLEACQIPEDKLSSMPIPLPPLSEQQAIVSYLDEKCTDIDRLIALKQQKIESLKNYKKSVIYEAVTGKTIIE